MHSLFQIWYRISVQWEPRFSLKVHSSSLNVTLNFDPSPQVLDMNCRGNLCHSGEGTAQNVHRASSKVQLTFGRTHTNYNVFIVLLIFNLASPSFTWSSTFPSSLYCALGAVSALTTTQNTAVAYSVPWKGLWFGMKPRDSVFLKFTRKFSFIK